MPVNGRIWVADALEFRVKSTASGSHSGDGTGKYTHQATLTTYETPNTSDLLESLYLRVGGGSESNEWVVEYFGPGVMSPVTWTGTGWDTVEAIILVTGVTEYSTGGSFRLVATVEVYAQGVLKLSTGVDLGSAGYAPAYLPLWGVLPTLTGSAGATTIDLPTYDDDDEYSYQSTCSATASGGWRWKLPGETSWQSGPVVKAPGSAPAITGGCEDPGVGAVAAKATSTAAIGSYAMESVSRVQTEEGEITACTTHCVCPDGTEHELTVVQDPPLPWKRFKTTTSTKSRGGWIMALPNFTKGVKRINSDYRALWLRTPMPSTEYSATSSCTINGVTSSVDAGSAVHPAQAQLLMVVGNTPAAIEDTFGYPSYAPWGQSGSGSVTEEYDTYIDGLPECAEYNCPAPLPGQPDAHCDDPVWVGFTLEPAEYSQSANRNYQFPSAVGDTLAGYLDHDEPLARYINTWANPHWSFFLWNEAWDLDGSPQTWDDYWSLIGSQYLHNTVGGITTNLRNHLVSDALANDGHRAFNLTYTAGLPWLGISRWITKAITPITEYTFGAAQADLWSSDDGTLTIDSDGIELAPGGTPATVEIALDLGSFATAPYMWPHLADRITCDWELSNITDVKVYLEGIEGTRILLNDNAKNVAKSRPSGKATKYAGSWAQDYGAGITTDQGDDATVDGLSAGVATDPEMACALQLLADRTATKLVYVVTVETPGDPITLKHPKFEYTLSADRKHVYENAHQCVTIHPNGPGVRTGMWDSGTGGTVLSVPDLYDPTERPNLVDYLVTARLLLMGMAPLDGLTTELANLYDIYEERSVGSVRSNSHGFWLPPHGANWLLAMVNSVAECPPLSNLPRRERGSDWQETGGFAQYSWAHHQDGSYYVNPAQGVQLREEDDTTVWSTASTGIDGWAITKHAHAVDNTETDFGIWLVSRYAQDIRPWRGYYSVVPPATGTSGIAVTVRSDWYVARGRIGPDGTALLSFAYAGQPPGPEVDTEIDADSLGLAWEYGPAGRLCMVIEDAGEIKYLSSEDEGGSWSMATTVATGTNTYPAITVTPDGVRHIYWISGGNAVKGRLYDAAMDPITSEFAVHDDIEDSGLAVDNARDQGGSATIEMAHIEDGSLIVTRSQDGQSFS